MFPNLVIYHELRDFGHGPCDKILLLAVLVKVAGWRVFGGLGLSCGGKNSLGRADFSWILEYLEEKSWENIGIKNFHIF